MKITTAAEMREIDRASTEKFGVPSLTLMENAGTRGGAVHPGELSETPTASPWCAARATTAAMASWSRASCIAPDAWWRCCCWRLRRS